MDYLLKKLNKDVMTIIEDFLRETEEERRLDFILSHTEKGEKITLLYTHLCRYNLEFIKFGGYILCRCNSVCLEKSYKSHLKTSRHKYNTKWESPYTLMNVSYDLI